MSNERVKLPNGLYWEKSRIYDYQGRLLVDAVTQLEIRRLSNALCGPFEPGIEVEKITHGDPLKTYDKGKVKACYLTEGGEWRVMVENQWRQQHVYPMGSLRKVET